MKRTGHGRVNGCGCFMIDYPRDINTALFMDGFLSSLVYSMYGRGRVGELWN